MKNLIGHHFKKIQTSEILLTILYSPIQAKMRTNRDLRTKLTCQNQIEIKSKIIQYNFFI